MQITPEGHAPVPAEAGDTILNALLRAGLPFPFSCVRRLDAGTKSGA